MRDDRPVEDRGKGDERGREHGRFIRTLVFQGHATRTPTLPTRIRMDDGTGTQKSPAHVLCPGILPQE